jgi:hypothetical protein
MKTLLLILLLPFTAIAATITVRVQVEFVDVTVLQPSTDPTEVIIKLSEHQPSTVTIEDDIVTVVYE